MKTIEKAGGFAALYLAAAYLAAMPFFLLVVDYAAISDPLQKLEALIAHSNGIYAMELAVYVFFGIFLAVAAVALKERLKAHAPDMMRVATPVALIWAGLLIASGMIHNVGMGAVMNLYAASPGQAVALWSAIDLVSSGLSGNGEILGGTWMLLVSVAALRSGGLPRALNFLGLAIASVGILSVVPILKDLVYVFGLGQIVWFVWLGIVLLRGKADFMGEQVHEERQ